MASRKAKKGGVAQRNDARNNRKAYKTDPGVPEATFTGRTTGGYSPAALARRAARRGGK